MSYEINESGKIELKNHERVNSVTVFAYRQFDWMGEIERIEGKLLTMHLSSNEDNPFEISALIIMVDDERKIFRIFKSKMMAKGVFKYESNSEVIDIINKHLFF